MTSTAPHSARWLTIPPASCSAKAQGRRALCDADAHDRQQRLQGASEVDTNGELIEPYCYADFDDNGTADLCATTVSWTNPGGTTLDVCVTEDGRTLTGRTASTRVRWAMKSYDSDAMALPDSAWVLFGAEKMKALGTVGDDVATRHTDPECTVYDIGKNMWYYTFEFDKPALGTQGMMLNSPALTLKTG